MAFASLRPGLNAGGSGTLSRAADRMKAQSSQVAKTRHLKTVFSIMENRIPDRQSNDSRELAPENEGSGQYLSCHRAP
jgi:hypothetical protein